MNKEQTVLYDMNAMAHDMMKMLAGLASGNTDREVNELLTNINTSLTALARDTVLAFTAVADQE